VPSHSRMRGFDRDLIRAGHYGQRPCEPHLKAEHMAAPTNAANVKKVLVNSEPSTHGTSRTSGDVRPKSAKWAEPDIDQVAVTNRDFMSTRPGRLRQVTRQRLRAARAYRVRPRRAR
jgi:hypothetical protein